MAITLNLKHTFTTRVVYSSEEVKELREGLEAIAKEGEALLSHIKNPKRKAESLAGINLAKQSLEYDDEGLILFLTKQGIKRTFRDDVLKELKEFNVTRMGPLQTEVVG